MSLLQIALRNLNRRRSKGAFMLIGLILASAAVVAIITIIVSMQDEISEQLADVGANIIITADSGELTFQYGGITIPELVFDSTTLSVADLDALDAVQDQYAIIAFAPKLIGTYSAADRSIVVAGVDLPKEFAVKPWLRLHDFHEDDAGVVEAVMAGEQDQMMEMDYEQLILERMENVPVLGGGEAVIGATLAVELDLKTGDSLTLGVKDYKVIAVIEETGYMEDNQLFISLAEAQNLLGRQGELTMIELTADLILVNENVLIARLEDLLPHASVAGVRQAVMGRNELLNSLSRFGFFTGSLVVLTGFFVVSLTMLSSVKERTREIGVFRAIGFRSRDIFTIIISEALLVGVLGGLAGYHVGLAVARFATPVLTGTTLSGNWDIMPLVIVSTVTALAGSLAGFIPALSATRLDPAEALRYN